MPCCLVAFYCNSSQKYPALCKAFSTARGERSRDSIRSILSLSYRSTFQRKTPFSVLIRGDTASICFLKRRLVLKTSTSISIDCNIRLNFFGYSFRGSPVFIFCSSKRRLNAPLQRFFHSALNFCLSSGDIFSHFSRMRSRQRCLKCSRL